MKRSATKWESEAAMVASFVAHVGRIDRQERITNPLYKRETWTVYPETADWDLVLVRDQDGFQIGVEAKLSLNAEVMNQALSQLHAHDGEGPDCWAVLVPDYAAVNGLTAIARHLGVVVISAAPATPPTEEEKRWGMRGRAAAFHPELPRSMDHRGYYGHATPWPERCPDRRIKLPEYVPDVSAGVPSPTKLTEWKIKAIKIAVILEKRGHVSRADFMALGIDMARWTQGLWIQPMNGHRGLWRRAQAMPDFRRQHPVNYGQIEGDVEKWLPPKLKLEPLDASGFTDLLGDAA